jgi:hypothetical protein
MGLLRADFKLAWAVILMVFLIPTGPVQGQGSHEGVGSHEWEATVVPPPPGEWINNMPGRMVPREMPAYTVRAFYVVPSNRTAMADAVPRMQAWILAMQAFYRDQMERYGFGPKTFSFETEADGVSPKIHIVNAPQTDAYYRQDPWGRVPVAAQNSGLPVWAPRQMWLGIFEGHVMNADGSIDGIFNGGATFGSGDDGGLALLGSNALACGRADLLMDFRNYNGLVLPDLGPHPMQYGVTGAAFEGRTVGEYASTWFGAVLHEMGHGFGLMHDMRNDVNAKGNLMGFGFRGFRQWMHPDNELFCDTWLSYGNALLLNSSRYFNTALPYVDDVKPTLSAETTSGVTLINGCLPVSFTAQDGGGLALAQLILNGNLVAQMPLSGTNAAETFLTPYYLVGANAALIWLFDAAGNKQTVDFSVTTVPNVGNRAPQPMFQLLEKSVRATGELVRYRALSSIDPDNTAAEISRAYDLDGDGIYEEDRGSEQALPQRRFAIPGTYVARARISDTAGNQVVSEPITVKIVSGDAAVADWNLY